MTDVFTASVLKSPVFFLSRQGFFKYNTVKEINGSSAVFKRNPLA